MKFPFFILSRKKYLSFSPSSELEEWKEKFNVMKGNLEGIIEMDKRGYEMQIKDLNVQIRNFKAGTLELQQEQTSQKEIIASLRLRNKELEERINEQVKIIHEASVEASTADIQPKRAPDMNDAPASQIKNLKTKIAELEKEIETQRQITFQKNQELNKLNGK